MTLSDLTHLAQATLTASSIEERAALGQALAQGFVDRLSESQPCGWEAPEIVREEDMRGIPKPGGPLIIRLPQEWVRWVDADDADHMARMLLAAADAARAEESGDE